MTFTKQCLYCKSEFTTTNPQKSHCSRNCTKRKSEEKLGKSYVYRKCQGCGKKYRRLHAQQKTCSPECYKLHVNEKARKKHTLHKNHMSYEYIVTLIKNDFGFSDDEITVSLIKLHKTRILIKKELNHAS